MTSVQRFAVLAAADDPSLVALMQAILSDDFEVTTTTSSPREALRLICGARPTVDELYREPLAG